MNLFNKHRPVIADQPPSSDSTDWNQIWNDQIRRYRAQNAGRECFDKWQSRTSAIKYWKMAMATQQQRIEKTLRELPLSPKSRILDIGSGPGVLAIPLARKVAHVTGVDTSAGMIEVLKEKATEAGINNVACLTKRWEAVDTEKELSESYDIVLASLSLTMYDIWTAVSKMEQVCRGHIYLYWFTGEPPWEGYRGIFEPYAGKNRPLASAPKCELLLKILRQNGIHPNCEDFQYVHVDRFFSIDDAVRHFANRFRIPPARQTAALRNSVRDLLEPCTDNYLLRSKAACMKIWWQAYKRA